MPATPPPQPEHPDGDVQSHPDTWPAWADERWEDDRGPALTVPQADVLAAIASSIAARGYAPTVRELGLTLGIRSAGGVLCHLKALEKKGWIRRDEGTARGIVLVRGTVRRGGPAPKSVAS